MSQIREQSSLWTYPYSESALETKVKLERGRWAFAPSVQSSRYHNVGKCVEHTP